MAAYVGPALGGVENELLEASSWGEWPRRDGVGGLRTAFKSIRVDENLRNDDPISLEWSDDALGDVTLRIGLAQAEEAKIELSSQIRQNYLHQFAVYEWLDDVRTGQQDDDGDDITLIEAYRGRHPLLSPPITVNAVHAVKRPLVDPTWTNPVPIVRVANDTAAVLKPTFTPDRLHTDSTGRIEIAATWQEWIDNQASKPTSMTSITKQSREATRLK